jgi:putative membrane protein
MKNLTYLALGVITLLLAQSCYDKHGKNFNYPVLTDNAGVSFIKNGIEGGLTEIKASSLAATNSTNPSVVSFAKMMIEDHTKAGEELKVLKDSVLIIGKDSISGEHQQVISDLSKQTGAAFDKAYIQMMVEDHEHAVELFKDGAQNIRPEIGDFAAKTLPTIEKHLESAKSILASLK